MVMSPSCSMTDWAEGASSGLRAGLDTMWRSPHLETAVVLDVAFPGVDADVLVKLLESPRSPFPSRSPSPNTDMRAALRSWSIVFLWPRLMGLEGPVDLVEMLNAHADWLQELWIDLVPPRRIDTADDLVSMLGGR